MPAEFDTHLAALMIKSKKRSRDDLWNTAIMAVIAAALAYWAYHTVAHAVLFAFLAFVIVAMGNRISNEIHQWRSKIEANQLMDKLGM